MKINSTVMWNTQSRILKNVGEEYKRKGKGRVKDVPRTEVDSAVIILKGKFW